MPMMAQTLRVSLLLKVIILTFEFKFPDIGEGVTEGVIVSWKVKEGDIVKEDAILGEVETSKAVVEIPSPRSGKILKLHGAVGDIVKVGDTLVTFGDEMNDMDLLRQADYGVAVENGVKELREVADEIIGSNSDDAVTQFILNNSLIE